MSPITRWLVPAICLLTGGGAFAGTEIQLVPVADNTMFQEDSTYSNGAGRQFFCGRNTGGLLRRALLRFDVSAIPPGAQILDATLRLTVWRGRMTSTVAIHRLLEDWGEAGSDAGEPGGFGAPADTGDATWEHRFYPDDHWSTPGGVYVSTESASRVVGTSGSHEWTSTGLIADVQAWVDGSATNFGWICVGDEATDQSAKAFDSREYPSSGVRPRLTITYEVPVAAADPFPNRSWSVIKSHYRPIPAR
jgi:hypothetical protein